MTVADRDTLDAMYRLHAPSVFRRARRLLGNDADAHEVVQDLFVSLFERPEQFSQRSTLTTFLYSATTHACLNRIRNKKRQLHLLATSASPLGTECRAGEVSPERLTLLHGMLARMPEELARVAMYYCVDDLTHDDIARLLGCSRRHVGNLLERLAEWGKAEESR
jgi:RNA polymerase sigma factor (sigma-70 family)